MRLWKSSGKRGYQPAFEPYLPFIGIINLRSTNQPFTGIINPRSTLRPLCSSTFQTTLFWITKTLKWTPSHLSIRTPSMEKGFQSKLFARKSCKKSTFLISCYFVLSSYFVISLNFKKQFQEMMNKFKIKPIRVRGRACQLYSSLLGAHTCWPNEPQILHQHHLHQIIGHPEHPRTNPAHKFRWRLYQSHHTKSTSEAHQGEGNSGHHEQYHHGHLQLSLCQIPLQTQPTWPRRELLRHHQENSYITVMISSQPAIATKINKYIQQ